MSYCANCGNDITGKKFCPKCGQSNSEEITQVEGDTLQVDVAPQQIKQEVPSQNQPVPPTKPHMSATKQSKLKKMPVLFIILAIAIVALVALAVLFLPKNSKSALQDTSLDVMNIPFEKETFDKGLTKLKYVRGNSESSGDGELEGVTWTYLRDTSAPQFLGMKVYELITWSSLESGESYTEIALTDIGEQSKNASAMITELDGVFGQKHTISVEHIFASHIARYVWRHEGRVLLIDADQQKDIIVNCYALEEKQFEKYFVDYYGEDEWQKWKSYTW